MAAAIGRIPFRCCGACLVLWRYRSAVPITVLCFAHGRTFVGAAVDLHHALAVLCFFYDRTFVGATVDIHLVLGRGGRFAMGFTSSANRRNRVRDPADP